MKPTVLKVSEPKVASVFADLAAMQRWEVLRRSDVPMAADELAAECRVAIDVVQRTLDRLLDAGLVVRIKASSRSRRITYRAVSKEVIFEYDEHSTDERRWVLERRESHKRYARDCIDRAHATSAIQGRNLRCFWCSISTIMNDEESRQAHRAIVDAMLVLLELEKRALARAREARSLPEPEPKPKPSGNFFIRLELQELAEPELPIPHFILADSKAARRHVAELGARANLVLAERELEVARLLATGASRPKIAAALGLSPNTIATVSKRIYSKLQVHSRAELAARMRAI